MLSIKVVGAEPVLQESSSGGSSWQGMGARRAVRRAGSTARSILVKPVVVMAARFLGPGPLRLRMVKLAHTLGTVDLPVAAEQPFLYEVHGTASAQPTRRAA